MTASQYAAHHNLTLNYVYRLIRAGRIQVTKRNDKLRYDITDAQPIERRKPGPKGKEAAPQSSE